MRSKTSSAVASIWKKVCVLPYPVRERLSAGMVRVSLLMIKNSKLRGVESYGMICASDEIGLGDLFPADTGGRDP